MLINSDDIKTTKEKIEVMEAFINGKEIEFKKLFTDDNYRTTANAPIWDFTTYNYRIKPSDKEKRTKFTNPLHSHSDSFWENSEPIEKTNNVPFFPIMMADELVELGIELPDYMVKQLSPEKLDYLTKKAERLRKETGYPKFEESIMEDTVVKYSEQEYVYPIYKRLKEIPETIVEFTGLDSGIYISTEAQSIYKPGDAAKYMRPHTSCSWEDYDFTEKKEEEESSEPEYVNTEELFEVIYYCDIMKEFIFVKQLYLDEDLKYLKHHQKTGRSFIIGKDTRQIIKVINK